MRGRKKERQRYLCGTKKRGRAIVADEKKTKLSWRLKKERHSNLGRRKKKDIATVSLRNKRETEISVQTKKETQSYSILMEEKRETELSWRKKKERQSYPGGRRKRDNAKFVE